MKALLLKDFYLLKSYCRTYLLLVAVFMAVSFVSPNNMFFAFYPVIMISMTPATLLSYDEKEQWDIYSGTLPYTKAQMVTAKYLIGLLLTAAVIILNSIVQMVQMISSSAFTLDECVFILAALVFLGLVSPTLSMPLIFRFGAEMGRIVYLVVIAAAIGMMTAFMIMIDFDLSALAVLGPGWIFVIAALAAFLLYVLSWRLSVWFYQKREK